MDHQRDVPFHLLPENPEFSAGDPGTGNLLVQGDNPLALKALLSYYSFVSIDDKEANHLRMLHDAEFDARNFVAT
ncbi:MAG: hypothetical protein H0V12_04405 [Chloroflexi bacterium]|nr:hypothetical protein [Chloroflexota bacterium]